MNAPEIASKAASLIGGDRADQHGEAKKTFERIARLWNAYIAARKNPYADISAVDVGWMMVELKKARSMDGVFNMDDYVDACGYIALAGELAKYNHGSRS